MGVSDGGREERSVAGWLGEGASGSASGLVPLLGG